MNSFSCLGRLAQDSELKRVGDNDLLTFTIANDVGFGEKKTTNWVRCSIWGKRAQSMFSHFTKGISLFVTGELSLRTYTKKEGGEGSSLELRVQDFQFAGGKNDGGSPSQASQGATQGGEEDDCPF